MIWASKAIILILIISITTKYHYPPHQHYHKIPSSSSASPQNTIIIIGITTKYPHPHHRHHHKISPSSCPDRPDQTPGGPVLLPPKAGSHRPGYSYIFISLFFIFIFLFIFYIICQQMFSLFWLWGQGLKLKYVVIFWLFTKQSDLKVGTRSPLSYYF